MGLHPKTDERMVYKFFATNCGKICDVQIVKDPHSGRSKGNGYVEFYEASSVLKAINFSGTPVNGQPIRVQPVNMPRNLDVPETPLERQVQASDKLRYTSHLHWARSLLYPRGSLQANNSFSAFFEIYSRPYRARQGASTS